MRTFRAGIYVIVACVAHLHRSRLGEFYKHPPLALCSTIDLTRLYALWNAQPSQADASPERTIQALLVIHVALPYCFGHKAHAGSTRAKI